MTTPYPESPDHAQGQTPPPPPQAPQQPQVAQQPESPPLSEPHPAPQLGYPVGPEQTVLDPAQQRQWGMFAHLIGVAAMVFSAGLLGFVGTLAVYLLYRDRGDYVRRHAANSVNVQIMMGVLVIVGIIFCVTVIGLIVGIPLLIAAYGWAFVVHVIGAIKANNGELWDPPFTPRFVR